MLQKPSRDLVSFVMGRLSQAPEKSLICRCSSGSGTNLRGNIGILMQQATIELVVSSRPDAYGRGREACKT